MFSSETVISDLNKIRSQAPLVHNITNYVAMNITANALLSIGASPVMAHALEEVEDMVKLASAVVINIGTLSPAWVEAMVRAMETAAEKKIPVVLDPVGAGATSYRTETARYLVGTGQTAIIRGNASEIKALVEAGTRTKGVDSLESSQAALEASYQLSKKFGVVVSVSGPVDYVVKDADIIGVANGHPLMPLVTGLGCTATALTAAFAAINPDYLQAAAGAMAVMGLAGELAGESCAGPASFQVAFLDWLYRLSDKEISARLKIK
ncbi:MAG TPA: hydroxyethylthiazole kinase [Candidatus Saccharicenans sp.]|jgi:hydroxyethylthiazole kinase|nr:hydroxyethylthiazole kinase [Candidatus Saccharicenans sp.]HRD01567.1 hydroxyethylthiazole kinase [Candidatus Saccharicenans sp.]